MKGRSSGGITLAVSESLRENYTVIYKANQVTAIVFRRLKIAIIVSDYQPYSEIEELIQEVSDELSNAIPDYHIVLLGDFNCRIVIPNEKQEFFFDFIQDNSFICWKTPEMPTYK